MSSPEQPGTTGDDQIPPIPPAPGAEVPPVPSAPEAAAPDPNPAAEPAATEAPAAEAATPAAPAAPVNPYAPPSTTVPTSAPAAPAAPANPYAAPAAAPAAPAAPANPYAAAPQNPYAAPGASAPAYAAATAAPAGPSRLNVMGLVSLIAGGIAFLFGVTIGWIPFVGFFFVFLALVGVVLGIVGLVMKNKAKGLAIAGTIVSGVALLLTAAISIFMLIVATSISNSLDDYDDYYGPDAPSVTDPDGTTSEGDTDDGGLGSQSNPASPGDTITFTDLEGVDEWQVVVGTANLDATADILAAYEYNTEPEPGNQYVVVPITLTYVGTETGAPYNIYAQFLGSDALLYDVTYANYPNTLYEASDLAPGGSQDINLVFEVSSDAVDGGLLSISSIWTDPIYVSLG
jgi:hypothetical protein